MVTDKVCAKCEIKWNSALDRDLQSPGVGCGALDENNDPCLYWIHACCLGLTDARKKDFENLEFYCPQHNPTTRIIKDKKEVFELRNKNSRSKAKNRK